MSENPRRGGQARNFTTNVPKILDLKSSSEQIFFRKLSLGVPALIWPTYVLSIWFSLSLFTLLCECTGQLISQIFNVWLLFKNGCKNLLMHISILFLWAYEFLNLKTLSNFAQVKCASLQKRPFPDSFNDMFYLTVTHIHISKNSFHLPYYKTNLRTFSLCFQGPKIFNSLSTEIQNASSTAVFTSKQH